MGNNELLVYMSVSFVVVADAVIIVFAKASPEPVGSPYVDHLVDGDAFGLRQEEERESAHDSQPRREEEEDPELERAEHGQEGLRHHELEEHIGEHGNALGSRADVLGADLAGDEPRQRAPRRSKHGLK